MDWFRFFEHLQLVATSVAFTVICGLPIGVGAYLFPTAGKFILRAVDILQTIPSLALLGMVMTVFGAGKTTVVVGLVLYAMLPVVTNTYVGLNGISPGIKDAAMGMGMTKLYCLVHVELPNAFPIIFTGIRIATVTSVGAAVFAAYVGGGGLGSLIHRGMRIQSFELIAFSTFSLMVMAVAFDTLMGFMEKRLQVGPHLQLRKKKKGDTK